MPRSLAMGVLGALSLTVSAAQAQGPAPAPAPGPGIAMLPPITRLQLTPLIGEPTGAGGFLPPPLAVLPLRLSLFNDAFPLGHFLPGDGCASSEEAVGNTFSGFAAQRQAYLPLGSRLSLHAFSRAGCPLDSLAGAGATFALPLPKDMWLVASAGIATQPVAAGRSVLHSDARLDFVFDGSSKRALAVGIGKRGFTFSGLW
jgi:hypothetical protein